MTIQEMIATVNSNGDENFTFCYNLEKLIDNENIEEAIAYIQKRFNCNQEIANQCFIEFKKQIYDEFKKIENENPLSPEQIAYNNMVARESLNKPKCPTCNSTNVQKISTGERVTSVAILGLFSKKINKSFKCKNCGHTW